MKGKWVFLFGKVVVLMLMTAGLEARAEGGGYTVYLPLVTNRSGASWQEVGAGSASGGGVSNNSGNTTDWGLSMAIAPDGTPYVAWDDDSSGNYEIYVLAWNGNAWVEVGESSARGGGISNNVDDSYTPSIAITSDGKPMVTWMNKAEALDSHIYVRAWNGFFWEEVGEGSASGDGISGYKDGWTPSIAIAPDGTPYVAWESAGGAYSEIYLRAWDGVEWAEVGNNSASSGGISNTFEHSFHPSVAVSPNGQPYVAWQDYTTLNWNIYIRTWDGSSWSEVGVNSATGGGLSNNAGWSLYPSVAIGTDGNVYVAWEDNSNGNYEIYLLSWNGTAWVEVGQNSASNGGISNNLGSSHRPSVTISQNDTPMVAWADSSYVFLNIFVLQWTGLNWLEVGAGSASGGGISQTSSSFEPFIAIAPDGTPYVAWLDYSGIGSGDAEIYIRRYTD